MHAAFFSTECIVVTHNNLIFAADSAALWGGERASGSDSAVSAPFSCAFLQVRGERSGGRLSELVGDLHSQQHKSGLNI